MWKLFDDASAGFVEEKRRDFDKFELFFFLIIFSLFWFGYVNELLRRY